jgi:large subunit ribosomal protein L5
MSKKIKNNYIPRLLSHYKDSSVPYLMKKLNIKNINRLPKIEKVVLNIGLGDARDNANALKNTVNEMTLITGQKPVVALAKKPISNFKTRQGDPVGVFVTLRRNQMYEFLDRFISSSTPRIRDFRGLPNKGFDGMGNYNFGISEQVVFPEIDYDKVDQIRGMNITIVTSGQTDEEAYELLLSIGLPIRKKKIIEKEEAEA